MPTEECLFSLAFFFFNYPLKFFSSLITCLVKVRSQHLSFESHEQRHTDTIRGGICKISVGVTVSPGG